MKKFSEYTTIFFDLDGTLSDSKVGIIHCLQYSLAKFGIKEMDLAKLARCIGPSLSYTYKEWYGLTELQAREANEFYREHFEKVGIKENYLYAGIPELIKALHAAGKNLVLATAKPQLHAKKILEDHGLAQYFTVIAGSNLDGTREDKGEVIAFALAQLGSVANGDCLMIGDRQHDVVGAQNNNLAVIAVGYGYGTMSELTAAKPDALVNSVEQLREKLMS